MDILKLTEKISMGGPWLGECHEWMQGNIHNGDRLTWGSGERVTLTVAQLEEMARRVAIAAIMQYKNNPSWYDKE